MNPPNLIFAGALFNAGFGIFHLFFWRLFHWEKELPKLNAINRRVMPILNLCLILVFFGFAIISWLHPQALLTSDLGKSMLLFITLFWFARAGEQIIYFRLRRPVSLLFFALFSIGTLLYALPLFSLYTHSI